MAEVSNIIKESWIVAGQVKQAIAERDAEIERLRKANQILGENNVHRAGEIETLRAENAKLRAEHGIDRDPPRREEYEDAPLSCYKCGAETNKAMSRAHRWICWGCWQEEMKA